MPFTDLSTPCHKQKYTVAEFWSEFDRWTVLLGQETASLEDAWLRELRNHRIYLRSMAQISVRNAVPLEQGNAFWQ